MSGMRFSVSVRFFRRVNAAEVDGETDLDTAPALAVADKLSTNRAWN